MNNLQEDILHKIKAGEIDMKPKWRFVLEAGLWLSGLLVALLVTIYLISFVMYFLKESGLIFAPGYGFRGISLFVISSPWVLIIMSLVFIVILYFLIKRYTFSFRQPLLFTMIGIVVCVIIGSIFIQQTTIHERVHRFTQRHELPGFLPLYREALGRQPEGLVAGTIIELKEGGFVLETEEKSLLNVVITDKTRIGRGLIQFRSYDRVIVFGDQDGDIVNAFGIRPQDKKEKQYESSRERGLFRLEKNE